DFDVFCHGATVRGMTGGSIAIATIMDEGGRELAQRRPRRIGSSHCRLYPCSEPELSAQLAHKRRSGRQRLRLVRGPARDRVCAAEVTNTVGRLSDVLG